jgi:hypothetical protein
MDTLREWNDIPDRIEHSIQDLTPDRLDVRGGSEGMSARETVHHLLEANLVAANMIIAALGTDEYEFDWGWLFPDREWMARLGYDTVDIEPAMALLRSLAGYISALLNREPSLMSRKIRLRDSGDSEPYAITVEGILAREVEHARGHLDDLGSRQ